MEEDLTCPVCCDIFTDPVVLTCSHSFCKTCVQEYWKIKELRDCPVCRRNFLLAELPCNRALKNLCESFKETTSQRTSAGSEPVCKLHNEKLKLFCLEDKEPVCLVCQASRNHMSHHFVPVDEAAQDHRKAIQTALKPLEDTLKMFNEVKQTCDQTADHIKTQADNTKRNIKEEFKKLHQFLQEEEEAMIAALREEEKQKSETIKEKIKGMNRQIASLSGTIKVIEEELKADDISFLQNLNAIKERTQVTLPDQHLVSGALINVAKHLGNLTFRVWEKMKEVVKFTPVILDPNTANHSLSLSKDLTSMGQHGPEQQLPDNPERFYCAHVLGSEGFSSGKHSWEVEVGDHPDWNIGVARESFKRKGQVKASPENGIWCISLLGGEYTNGLGETLPLKRRPQRIRVQLDSDSRGKVSFSNPEDKTPIYTYKNTITEKLYPYFNVGKAGDAKHPDAKILQSELSVSVMSSY